MRKKSLFLTALVLAGCSRADVEILGRIGQRVAQRTDELLNAEPNKSMIRTLPMLQAPHPADLKNGADPKQVPPRLNVE